MIDKVPLSSGIFLCEKGPMAQRDERFFGKVRKESGYSFCTGSRSLMFIVSKSKQSLMQES